MDWLTQIYNYMVSKISGSSNTNTTAKTSSSKVSAPIIKGSKNSPKPNEITMMPEISDAQLQTQKERAKYITTVKNPDYKVKQNDNPDKIAQKYGVTTAALLAANGLNEQTAKKIRAGQTLKIPPSRKVKGVNNLNDIAKAMGVSPGFIKNLKKLEDSKHLPENKFHLTPYIDEAGVKTIGIGHRIRPGDKTKLNNAQEACTLCAKDLLRAEEHLVTILGNQKIYDRIPAPLKEAVLDLTFNKGIIDDPSFKGLIYCLKNAKWEAAINKLTFNKSINTKQEMSGLSKRRLFDIATAAKMFGKKIPQSNINTAQQVYNRGIELLRIECRKSGKNFANQLVGYNKDVQSYFGNNIKLISK